jgi:small subunit ribosomal protein S8
MITDPLSDLLTRIRNAQLVGHRFVEVPSSKLKVEMVRLLVKLGFLATFELLEAKTIRIKLKYDLHGHAVIKKMIRVSKPGLRVYSKCDKLPRILSGAGAAIVSTSQGLKSDSDARSLGLGGEVLCYVY